MSFRAASLAGKVARKLGLSAPRRAAPANAYPQVELVWWRPANGSLNFGDLLSKIIVEKVLYDRQRTLMDEASQAARLLGIGSILHFAGDGDVVWGSGRNGKIAESAHTFKDLDVRAVRGPLTAAFLQERGIPTPAVYGDPALLLPTLFGDRFTARPVRKHVFVPNLHDLSLVQGWDNVVSPLQPWHVCVEQILGAEMVLASSLHGLVIAEAFGLPARYVRLSQSEDLFKYKDYVQGVGRASLEFAGSVEEGLEMGGMPAIKFDPKALLAAFPEDLWMRAP